MLNSLESPRKSAMYWQKRQSMQQIKSQKPMFLQLMRATNECMRQHPEFHRDTQAAIACETIHPQTLSPFSNFTFHTHPHDIQYPSDKDKQTTKRLHKDYLLIGLPTRNQVIAFHKNDNFQNVIARF